METPIKALRRRSFGVKPPSTPATTPNGATYPCFLNQVLLHSWWLIKAESDSHGKRLGIGGFTYKEGKEVIRCFYSAPIVKRQDAVTLKTDDGITVMVLGYLNKSRTLENGFSHEICDHFLIGFPYDWAEYADLSITKERADFSASQGVSFSDAHRTITQNEASSAQKEQSLDFLKDDKTKAYNKKRDRSEPENVKRSGPLTRSRARLLDN